MKSLLTMLVALCILQAHAQIIDRAEYFIDTDPGIGKGINVAIGSPGDEVNVNFNVPLASLSAGLHNLYVRTRHSTGSWGFYEKRTFYIAPVPVNVTDLAAAEYFFDTDPGAGKGNVLNVGNGAEANLNLVIPVAALTPGFHNLYIRFKDGGHWGAYEKRMFYMATTGTDVGNIVAAEYFFDSDPGIGNGAALALTTGGANISQTFSINVPEGTPDGKHFLFIRTRNAEGKWSLFDFQEFRSDRSLPVTGMELTATKASEKSALLKWFTYTEINNSHFEVERSKNGIVFEKIGQVAGKGNSTETNYYAFTDPTPLAGMNYYRLKQVDLDGTVAHSRIVNLLFSDEVTLVLYPNPTTEYVNVKHAGVGEKLLVQIFNNAGQLLQSDLHNNAEQVRVNVKSLSSGTYHLRVSDGVTVQGGRFMKN